MNKLKHHDGITIIALIVIIVILLILAGITIATLTGDNGIINKANEAKLETEIAQDKEMLSMYYIEKTVTEIGDVELEDYLNYIEEQGIPTKQENEKNYAELNGKIYEISMEDGQLKIEYIKEGEITEPRIQEIEIIEKTLTSIEIKVTAIRMEGGTYTYYIGTSEDQLEEKGTNQTGEYTFEGLTQGQTYYIKVEAENTQGDKTEKTIQVTLEAIPQAEGNIEYEIKWSLGSATVELTTQSNYTIEFSTDNTKYTKGTTINGLKNGDTIYARLTDGTYSGEEIQIDIIDSTKPEIALNKGETTTKSIEIIALATDQETGIGGEEAYKYYISNASGEMGTTPEGTNGTGRYTFENLDQNIEYTIKVEVEDLAGNKQEAEIRIQTELIPTAQEGIERQINWNSDGTAKVTLSTQTEFEIEYSTNRSNWNTYPAEGIELNNGESIYISLTDGRNRGADYQINASDTEGPEVTVTRQNVKANEITVKVEAQDRVSGMPENAQYNYYIKTSQEDEYTLKAENQTSNTYTFTGLTAQTTYNIKVTTKDIVGNEGEGTVNATTNEFTYAEGNIKIGTVTWSNKEASLTLTNNTEYTMEYKVTQNGEIELEGGWTTAQDTDQLIEGLKHGNRVIGRLTDGINTTTGYATILIEDKINPSLEVTGNATDWTKESVTLVANSQDNESGLQAQAYSFNGGQTWQAENTKTYDQNTSGIIVQVKDEAGNIASQTINIDKIDKDAPVVNIETQATSNTIKVTVTSYTDGTGIGLNDTPEFRYYITANNAELETIEPTRTSTNTQEEFPSLTQNTPYYIKVELEDKLGNISKTYRTVSTGSLDASSDDIKVTDPQWENKQAKVQITNNSTYNMQYQVVKSGTEYNPNANWTLVENAQKETEVSGLLHGDTVYVRLTDGNNVSGTIIKEVQDTTNPSIQVTGNATDWTKENITITVNAQDNESGLQAQAYSFDGQTWQEENTKTYQENAGEVTIRVRDEAGNIASQTINIDKIDKQGPSITIQSNNITTRQATVEITSKEDTGVGMEETPTYTYYIKEGQIQQDNPDLGFTKQQEIQQESYTFDNLKANTTYTIKVEAKDKLGNIGKATIEITTRNLIYQEDITFTNPIWSNSIATVTAINSKTEYDIEYQIGKAGTGINVNGQWTKASEDTIEIGNLENGDKVYARLTDGVNVTSGYATCNVNNEAKETYTEQELAQETTIGQYDILGISVGTNELRLQIEEAQTNAKTYNYYYKTINEEEYKLISTNTYHNDPAVITDVQEGAIYKIKVLVIDEDNNVTRSENTATMIALGEAQKNQTYTDNRTYIDDSKEIEVRTTAGTGTAGTGQTQLVPAGHTVSLPENFKISGEEGETKQEEGIVLKDANENEYVWIPVNDAIYDEITDMPENSGTASRTYKPMATKQNRYDNYYESIIYTFNNINSWKNSSNTGIGKSGYREPSLITNNQNDGYTWNVNQVIGTMYDASEENYKNILGFNTANEFGEYLANNYNNMTTSVDSFGGFYIGRYETTIASGDSTNNTVVIGSKANSKVLSETHWYRMYLYQDNQKYDKNPYYGTASITSNMIWGSQWDAMLNYILRGDERNKVTTQIASQKGSPSNSGQDANDIINNIYDLSSNVYEWTQEANGTSYRTYRGGSYDTSVSGNASLRKQAVSTDQGPVFGTRMSLYIKSTNDTTGPEAKINNVTSTSNTVTVEVSALDKETGVSRYKYYITTDKSNWGIPVETSINTHTFTGLLLNTTYYIKVEAIDGAGNVGKGAQTQIQTTGLGNVAKEGITRTQKYGTNGNGIIQLSLKEEYKNSGYFIEYQVTENAGAVNPEGEWTKGEKISNLSNGQKIYAVISDGQNRSSDYYEETVEGLEEYAYIDIEGNPYTQEEAQKEENKGKTTYDTTIEYEDDEGNTATIPAGFQVGTTSTVNTINNGLVIKDQTGNEYVWIPVETAIETDTSTTSQEKAMARYQNGYNSGSDKKYYEGILYNFSGTTSTKKRSTVALGTNTNREPTLITSGADYTWNILTGQAKGLSYDTLEQYYKNLGFETTGGVEVFSSYTEFGQYMNEQYTNMIQSVDKYGGFYVGRYETSLNGTTNKDAIVQSQIGKTPISNQNWYRDYYYQDSNINPKNPYYTSTSVTSSMIWGSQWDAMLNWMLKDENTRNFVTEVTGNHDDKVATTGSYTNDLAKNIFDLSSNVGEWTQEGSGTAYREIRGGYAVLLSDKYATYMASNRSGSWRPPTMTTVYANPTNTGNDTSRSYLGSRMALYINNTEDTTPPTITVESTKEGTNSIEVTVKATDNESGISKYKYSISYKNFENDESFNDETDIISTMETYGNTYTIQELLQGQTYYIKIEVTNGVGLTNTVYTGAVQTEQIELQEQDITVEKVWGKEGEGKAYYELAEKYESEGYELQHQVVKEGGTYQEADQYWTQEGDTVAELSTGDTIYTRITDGINKVEASSYKTTKISELETYSSVYEETTKYEDYDTVQSEDGGTKQVLVGTAYIPAGFKVGTSSLNKKIANGLVIEDEAGNQYVWIPVENVVYDEETALTGAYKPMVRYQQGYNENTEHYYERIYYSFSGTTSTANATSYRLGQTSWREPSLVTGSATNNSWIYGSGSQYDAEHYTELSDLGITSPTSMGQYLNNKYTEMVESIEQYGGYYVGRYETSAWEEDNWEEGKTNTDKTGEIVKSVPNATPMSSINWYQMYKKQSSDYSANLYKESSSVISGMITGSQYDTMLNFILTGSDQTKVKEITGNHTGTRAKTGQFGSDIMSNIFDLGANVREWTTEANSSQDRAYRGGGYNVDVVNASDGRYSNTSTFTHYIIGSRLALYLK